jgi:ribosomal protein L13
LNGPDYEILQSVVKDPTKYTSALTSTEAMDKQAESLGRIAAGIEKTAMEAHGRAYTPRSNAGRTVVRTGKDKKNGRRVVQYSDGSTDYAD